MSKPAPGMTTDYKSYGDRERIRQRQRAALVRAKSLATDAEAFRAREAERMREYRAARQRQREARTKRGSKNLNNLFD